jgi:predicted metal-binding membrane protein
MRHKRPGPSTHAPSAGASADARQGMRTSMARQPASAAAVLLLSLLGWAFLAWLVVDMSHPVAELTMPASARWSVGNLLAIFTMWAVMMAAMMLPSALPMILAFSDLSLRSGERARGRSFVVAYLLVWFGFSVAATAFQWVLQLVKWVNPMLVSTSPALTAVLLLVAGIYQFSPLKRACLSHCRTPFGFLLGEWRAGTKGAFVMGLRHGLLCVGCCWALMALLFVGGVMNLAWIAALAVAVAVEKMAPHGDWLGAALGIALMAAGAFKLIGMGLAS